MATLNKTMLMGRLCGDPEAPKALPNGGKVIKFRFAVGRSKKNQQTGQWENDPNPLYIDCEAFSSPNGKRDLVALIEQYCKQGDALYLDGRLQLDQWDDKNGGGKRSKHKLVIDGLEFLGGNKGGNNEEAPARSGGGRRPQPQPDDGGSTGDDDSIPF